MNIIQEGQAASDLLATPLLQESLAAIESTITDSWKIASDPKVREELWYTLKGLERFKHVLTIAVESGKNEVALKEKFSG